MTTDPITRRERICHRQANDDCLLCKGTRLDAGPSNVPGGNLFCERRAHPVEIHIARNCAYVACVDGPNQRAQFIQRQAM
jgi:hypothetical protein